MEIIKDLPEVFEEFAEQRRNSFLTVKQLKDKGIPVVGAYCTYFPRELALAMGAVPVGLCSTSDETIPVAEKDLPKNLCPLIKSSYGFAVTNKCPFFYFSDLVVGEATCDGKKKMYELMADIKDVFLMELPNSQSPASLELWKGEVIRLKEYMEKKFEVEITEEKVREAVRVLNEERRALTRLSEVMKLDPTPITGYDLFKVLYGSQFKFDHTVIPSETDKLTDKILAEYKEGKMQEKKPRIILTGCPVGGATEKVIRAIEDNGGVIVAYENCTGAKQFDRLVDEDASDIYA
ncbi:MAG: 2-hydroxyacyl-CoA dehydratase, partial [Lachnospiraceae bacterium]|nr:2-hydroxyacyl-CoA dehydratase [Lachnospiraceae bacterium]